MASPYTKLFSSTPPTVTLPPTTRQFSFSTRTTPLAFMASPRAFPTSTILSSPMAFMASPRAFPTYTHSSTLSSKETPRHYRPSATMNLLSSSSGAEEDSSLKPEGHNILSYPEVNRTFGQLETIRARLAASDPTEENLEFSDVLAEQEVLKALQAFGEEALLSPVDFSKEGVDTSTTTGAVILYKGPGKEDRVYLCPISDSALDYGFLCFLGMMTSGWPTAYILRLPAAAILDRMGVNSPTYRDRFMGLILHIKELASFSG